VYVFPFLRGVMYWLKMSSLSFAGRMEDFDFVPALGVGIDTVLRPAARVFAVLAQSSLVVSIWLHWRFFRKRLTSLFALKRPATPRAWLRLYVIALFIAAVICFAVSPTTIMFWQVLIALPASALVLIMSAEELARTPHFRGHVQRAARAWGVATVVLLLLQAVGSPMYRCGAYKFAVPTAMFVDLHARLQCFK
jgi:membrane protease YdiL (CAAX protease family)